jgi:hypothetical protein
VVNRSISVNLLLAYVSDFKIMSVFVGFEVLTVLSMKCPSSRIYCSVVWYKPIFALEDCTASNFRVKKEASMKLGASRASCLFLAWLSF